MTCWLVKRKELTEEWGVAHVTLHDGVKEQQNGDVSFIFVACV